jgi:hypothetical protein
MENLWIASGDVQAGWSAELGDPGDDERLAGWMGRVLAAGSEHQVYRVREARAAGYPAGDGLPFPDRLAHRLAVDGVLDLGAFASADALRPPRITALMAWAGASGAPVEGDVEDLGALLRSLRPADAAAGAPHMLSCPPLELDGPLLDVRHPERTVWWRRRGRVVVDISVRSDLWSPWVPGVLAPAPDPHRLTWYDNRPLAERHTPRLNAFLADVRRATEAAGGTWYLDEEAPLAKARLATPDGFDLGAPNPLP